MNNYKGHVQPNPFNEERLEEESKSSLFNSQEIQTHFSDRIATHGSDPSFSLDLSSLNQNFRAHSAKSLPYSKDYSSIQNKFDDLSINTPYYTSPETPNLNLQESYHHNNPRCFDARRLFCNDYSAMLSRSLDASRSNIEIQQGIKLDHVSSIQSNILTTKESKTKQSTRSRKNWLPKEDDALKSLVQKYSFSWKKISRIMESMGMERSTKQVRDRYFNKLDPRISNDSWREEEDVSLLKLYKKHGKSWCKIAREMPGRTEMMVKNRFYKKYKHLTVQDHQENATVGQENSGSLTQLDSDPKKGSDSKSQAFESWSSTSLQSSREENIVYDELVKNANNMIGQELIPERSFLNEIQDHDMLGYSLDDFKACRTYSAPLPDIASLNSSTNFNFLQEESMIQPQNVITVQDNQKTAELLIKIDQRIATVNKLLSLGLFSNKWNNFIQKVSDEYIFIKENLGLFASNEEIIEHMNVLDFCLSKLGGRVAQAIKSFDQNTV